MPSGGFRHGAGRPGWHSKVEDCRSLDVRRLNRENMLRPGTRLWCWSDANTGRVLARIAVVSDGEGITLDYTADGVRVAERVGIARTACHYGQSRPWFTCPSCLGRVALLYLYGGRFACRKCHGLVYRSQSEGEADRLWRKQRKLEAKLGPNLSRPKGMHSTTRERILREVVNCWTARDDTVEAYLDKLGADF